MVPFSAFLFKKKKRNAIGHLQANHAAAKHTPFRDVRTSNSDKFGSTGSECNDNSATAVPTIPQATIGSHLNRHTMFEEQDGSAYVRFTVPTQGHPASLTVINRMPTSNPSELAVSQHQSKACKGRFVP
jgi:hypothetical protein